MAILTLFRHRFYKNDGTPNAGGKVYTYVAGTTTPTPTYTDSGAGTPNTNPIILDAKGEADIWVVGQIKVNVLESDDTQVTGWPVDNIGSGVSNNDATARWAGTASGSANALAISPSPAISAYAVGQSFIFKASANPNTSTTTIAVSGLSAIAVQSNGAACSGGEILANNFYIGVLDTITTCQISKIGEPTLAELGAAALPGSSSQLFSVGAGGATAAAAVRQDEVAGHNFIPWGDFTMNPWTRGTSFTNPATNVFTADRFVVTNTSAAVVDVLKTADSPIPAVSGYQTQHCLHADVTTADAAIAAGDLYLLSTNIEGLDVSSFGFGRAGGSGRYFTLPFWHKHTKVGTYCVSFSNSALDRSYVAEYTQAVTDTWELAVITVPIDETGTWLKDTGVGLRVRFAVACGSTFQTTANAWAAGNYAATSNQVNGLDSTSNNFKIALIRMVAGQVANASDSVPASVVHAICRRYYRRYVSYTSAYCAAAGNAPAQSEVANMRTTPNAAIVTAGALTNCTEAVAVIGTGSGACVRHILSAAGAGMVVANGTIIEIESELT